MQYIEFDAARPLDLIPMGRIAIDFNPVDYFKTLVESDTFKKYVGGSPANIAVGLARLGKKVGFIGKVSDDRFGDYVTQFFENEGIDTSHVTRAQNGEKLGLTFTEILSPTESSILMYRDGIADLMLHPDDVDEAYIASAKAILISGTALSQSPSREACLKAMYLAKKVGTRIVFDIDYRPYNWKCSDEMAIYYSIVAENSDMIMGSREEFDLTEAISAPGRTDRETADHWLAKGNKIIICHLRARTSWTALKWAAHPRPCLSRHTAARCSCPRLKRFRSSSARKKNSTARWSPEHKEARYVFISRIYRRQKSHVRKDKRHADGHRCLSAQARRFAHIRG